LAMFINGDRRIRDTAYGGAILASFYNGRSPEHSTESVPIDTNKRPFLPVSLIAFSSLKTPVIVTTIYRPLLTYLLYHLNLNLPQV
jgi:hypothetical protein